MNKINFNSEIEQAYNRIKDHIYSTPLIKAYGLSQLLDAEVYLKLENIQLTSSFKIRGAFNKLLKLNADEKSRGVVAASMGNHGAAVAFAGKKLNVPVKIFAPKHVSSSKIESMKLFGAEVILSGNDCLQAEMAAKNYANEHNQIFISPYNDLDIIFGQGTIGYELMQQASDIDEIYIAIGGGGLISGISAYTKSVDARINIIGCLPLNSPIMYESIKANKIIELENKPTLSDGTAGNIEANAITFDFCKQNVDDYALVTEDEIIEAIKLLLYKEHILVEGAAAITLAAAIKNKEQIKHKKIVLIICGGNISEADLKKVIC